MRIYGNRRIKTLSGQLTRPTTARVREALFQIWQSQVSGCHWLDLCSGSGSMGAEALCRGADTVIGIEQSGRACAVIRDNWQHLASPEQTWQVLKGDILHRLKSLRSRSFDRIYFDPPYNSDLYSSVLLAIATQTILSPDGEMAVEHAPKQPPPLISQLQITRVKTYGNSALTFYRCID